MSKRRIEKSNRIAVAQKIILFLTGIILANKIKKYNRAKTKRNKKIDKIE